MLSRGGGKRWAAALREWPLWLCAFRFFFIATAVFAVLAMLAWVGFLLFGWPLPALKGPAAGPFVWHAHEMLYGFTLAALAGFVLTAVPEFTATAAVARRPVMGLALLWLGGRLCWSVGGTPWGGLLAAVSDVGVPLGLLIVLAPRLWADPERRHLAFFWALGCWLALTLGFHIDLWRGAYPMRWLLASVGVSMVFIVVAMSRISMSIVNSALRERGDEAVGYVARPPRRNLAICCIAAYTAVEFFAPLQPASGWLALAAAAALFNLLNDWHVGRALLRRWPLMLYGAYWLMAIGYAVIGVSLLGAGDVPAAAVGAGRHVLMVGALGLAVLTVLNIAGRVHSGWAPDERRWVVVAAGLLVVAALARAAVALPGMEVRWAWGLAALCWMAAFGLYLAHMWGILTGPRTDGQAGCAGVAE